MRVEIVVRAGDYWPYATKRAEMDAPPTALKYCSTLGELVSKLIWLAVEEAEAKELEESEDSPDAEPDSQD